MNTKDDVSTDDKTTQEEEIEVRVEDDSQEPVKAETEGIGEDTPIKNETSKQESPEGKRSAGEVIADLGNEKKAIASNLVDLAKSNDTARQQVKEMLSNDPATANYLKSKFGNDYDFITGDKPAEKKEEVDVEKIKEEAKAQAQAEVIKSQMLLNSEKLLTEKAKELGFSSEEFEQYKRKVELLGGDEQAMTDAALIVNQSKATAKAGEYSHSGGEAPKPKTKQVTITPGLNELAESSQLDKKEFASDIQRVKDLHRKDVYGKPTMDLPGL